MVGGSMAAEGSPVYFLMTKITSFLNEVLNMAARWHGG